ncbi:putative transcription initiation factor IIE subunit alpha [Clavispora lusitaniae]|uniref:Transcription initiation factor IIE subunit alpha n=1 Tax=Clavispora lusitaniae TaxID=36911 RepID=A0ACD0WCC7_CLALS|nr:TFIIE alpha subunit family protein [Clavispora lusitaniae]QFZ25172.1 putative transcription initiation factor IIE subunit alpha [Clavispora lusitaniae]QFZ31525.1 putative transcription initiation factor IIE subunit alpha [Clavispora lusitaniae]QFZ37193.1 putative transcription initiation factor IIE subunit alpha [Clavispora lusitaniae]QFZ42877.1 putative transcription initiation factor IIE subunit alpha [Clavispora lusitaniae]
MDDTTRSLLRFVARGFYSRPYILILDAVLIHSVLSEDDLIYLLGINRKELRSLCNKLVDDRIIASHNQKEENPQQRLTNRTYYYIHITEAIDAIKWKVHSIVSSIKEEMSSYGNPHGYLCPRCGKKVSQLDAISLLSDDGASFICDSCSGVLVEDDSSQQASIKQEKLEKLMLQLDPIIGYLKKIDNSDIEDNNFEMALTKAIPAQSGSTASYMMSNRVPGKSKSQISQSLQNAASKANATLHVSITASDENYEREQQEKESRRQKLEQNALPSWHSASTVGQTSSFGVHDDDADVTVKEEKPVVKEEGEATPEVESHLTEAEKKEKEAQDVLAAYYADLAEREADEDDDDDDDDDDLEDLEDI